MNPAGQSRKRARWAGPRSGRESMGRGRREPDHLAQGRVSPFSVNFRGSLTLLLSELPLQEVIGGKTGASSGHVFDLLQGLCVGRAIGKHMEPVVSPAME